jgi:hypothetical protein
MNKFEVVLSELGSFLPGWALALKVAAASCKEPLDWAKCNPYQDCLDLLKAGLGESSNDYGEAYSSLGPKSQRYKQQRAEVVRCEKERAAEKQAAEERLEAEIAASEAEIVAESAEE